jgi:hypothetical protein
MTPDELAFVSTRLDPASYADQALDDLLTHCRIASARTQCYMRDTIEEAFEAGEHQGVCRAIVTLSIARSRARDPAERAALDACLRILVGVE